MFYCNNCADEKGYKKTLFKSFGKCEICGSYKECNNTPFKYMRIAKVKTKK